LTRASSLRIAISPESGLIGLGTRPAFCQQSATAGLGVERRGLTLETRRRARRRLERWLSSTVGGKKVLDEGIESARNAIVTLAPSHSTVQVVREAVVRGSVEGCLAKSDTATQPRSIGCPAFFHSSDEYGYDHSDGPGRDSGRGPSLEQVILVLRGTTERAEAVDAGTATEVGTEEGCQRDEVTPHSAGKRRDQHLSTMNYSCRDDRAWETTGEGCRVLFEKVGGRLSGRGFSRCRDR
jgi:hypothetical protein